jgi:hypothetical protein
MRYGYSSRPLKWFDYLPLRDEIDVATRPINSDYLLVFGHSGTNLKNEPVNTGYCDFEARRCWVNCEVANVEADPMRPWVKPYEASEEEQYDSTMYVSAHERAHARWTDFVMEDFEVKPHDGAKAPAPKGKGADPKDIKHYDRLLHTVFNILEDERIERLIERDFKYLRGYLRRGAYNFQRIIPQEEDFVLQAVVTKGGQQIPVPHDPADPSLVISWVLRRRVLNRAGIKYKSVPLSPENLDRLKEIEPLLRRAFKARNSRIVVEIAREIIDKLQIREYNEEVMKQLQKALSRMGGQRKPGDQAKGRAKGQSDEGGTVQRDLSEGSGNGDEDGEESEGSGGNRHEKTGGYMDGEENNPANQGKKDLTGKDGPDGKGGKNQGQGDDQTGDRDEDGNAAPGEGTEEDEAQRKQEAENAGDTTKQKFGGSGYTKAGDVLRKRQHRHQPAPYEEILNSIRPFLQGMSSLFRMEKPKQGVEYDRTGSRLDIRRAMRNNVEPFRTVAPPKKHGKISVRLVVDESGSMGGRKETEAKRVAMLFYEALRHRHDVGVALAPTGEILVQSDDGEIGKGFIAGYDSDQGTEFHTVMQRELEYLKRDRHSSIKYLLLVADGESGHHDGLECKKLVDQYKRLGVRCMGVGLCLSSEGDKFFRHIFGDFYLSITDAAQLLPQMSKILRTLASRAMHQSRPG